MADPFREQKIRNWATEFAESDEALPFPPALREYGAEIGAAFLLAACRVRDIEPDALKEADIKVGLLDGVAALALPASARERVPAYCAAFLAALQAQGRMAPGRGLPAFLRALRSAYLSRASGDSDDGGHRSPGAPKAKPITRPGSKLGLNDPCPCGSGKKYKKCCQRGFGS